VRGLGIEAAGHFQASWAISTQYVGFILTAMLADYLPRLSGVIGDEEGSNDLVNTQAQITLLLGGPVLLAALALAPWAIALLYSAAFHPAAELLRWQALGNVLKVLASPVGLINVARARGGLFILTEASWNLVFVLTTWATMPGLGLVGTGVAFVVSYALQLALLTLIVRRVHGFRWHRETVLLGVVLFGAGTLVLVLSYASSLAAALVGVAAAAGMAVFNLRAIVRKIGTQGRFGSRIARLYQWFGWPVEP
jgi:O-antigen/teichoic acid export membrane protein